VNPDIFASTRVYDNDMMEFIYDIGKEHVLTLTAQDLVDWSKDPTHLYIAKNTDAHQLVISDTVSRWAVSDEELTLIRLVQGGTIVAKESNAGIYTNSRPVTKKQLHDKYGTTLDARTTYKGNGV